jgi:hypothetical protein
MHLVDTMGEKLNRKFKIQAKRPLTLRMYEYCGLHFQIRRAHYHS